MWETGEVHTRSCWGNLRERVHLEDLGVDGRIILKLIFTTGWRVMDYIELAQKRDGWRAFMNVVMNLRVP